jgi:phosphoesterase RecJ-like protein
LIVRCPPPLVDFIHNYEFFFIVGHKEPDADCVGSQFALASLLRRLGKKTQLCSAGPFKRFEILPFKDLFLTDAEKIRAEIKKAEENGQKSAVIIVDCSSPERTGDIEKAFESLPLAVIDHHATGKNNRGVLYVDASAPACVVLIFFLFEEFGIEPDQEEAKALFLGLCTDTGFFRHLDSAAEEIFTLASSLVRAGASPKKTFGSINGGKSLDSRKLLGAILSRAQLYFSGRLIISSEELAETERYGLEGRDSDTLYQLFFAIKGVEAIAIIRQESQENCAVGLRSLDKLDVASVAAALGGGGHKNAAGFIRKGTIATLTQDLITEFEKILK